MTSVTALFNQKYKLNVICVFYFHFITSRPTTPPRELKLLTWRNWDPEEAAAATCASDCWIYCAPDTSYCLCILSLKAEIKNIESNHHSGKNRFKNDHNADLILSPAHPMHMWVIHLIGKTYRHTYQTEADVYILRHYRPIPILFQCAS